MIVDTHPHVISRDAVRYPVDPLNGQRSKWSAERPVTTEEYLAAMDAAGVARAVVVHSSTTYGYDNSYLADSIALYPTRLAGVGSVDFLADDAVEKLRYWMDERRIVGFRLYTGGKTHPMQSMWMDDPKTFPAWGYAQERDLPICVQMRPDGIGMLQNVLKRFPHLRIVLDHISRPNLEDGPPYRAVERVLSPLSDHAKLYLKISTANWTDASQGKATSASFLRTLVSAYGADRIMWGSNFPASEGTLVQHVQLALAACVDLSAAERDAFLGGTATGLYLVDRS